MKNRAIRMAVGALALAFAGAACAQDDLDRGKSGAQLYASDCAICHQSPQKLGSAGGIFGMESFLREHYTASRESAAVIAAYLRGVERATPAASARGRTTKRTAKGDERGKPAERKRGEKKPDVSRGGEGKPADAKRSEKSAETTSSETKPAEKPSEAKSKSSEARAAEPKVSEPGAAAPKPGEGAKSESKSEK